MSKDPPANSSANSFTAVGLLGLLVAVVRELYPAALAEDGSTLALLEALEKISSVLSGNAAGVEPEEAERIRRAALDGVRKLKGGA